jgi:hypothetical protein
VRDTHRAFALEVILQGEIVILHHGTQLVGKRLAIHQVGHAQASARNLVLIGGADAPTGCTDCLFAARLLSRVIEPDVVGQDKRARFTDA